MDKPAVVKPVESEFTDRFLVDCPHACVGRVTVTIVRVRGGEVLSITIKHDHEPAG